jgi:hypothetical protein
MSENDPQAPSAESPAVGRLDEIRSFIEQRCVTPEDTQYVVSLLDTAHAEIQQLRARIETSKFIQDAHLNEVNVLTTAVNQLEDKLKAAGAENQQLRADMATRDYVIGLGEFGAREHIWTLLTSNPPVLELTNDRRLVAAGAETTQRGTHDAD